MSKEKQEKIAGYLIHPAASLFPLMGNGELKELAEDIAANGQREAILGLEDKDAETFIVIDGRNRLAACEKAGIEPWVEPLEVPAGFDAVSFIASKNLKRRHLTTEQRAAIAAELTVLKEGTTVPEAAEALNVSPRSVSRARKRMREAPEEHIKAKAGKRKAKKEPKPKGTMSARQEAWAGIVSAVNRLYKASQAAHVLDEEGEPTDIDLEKLVKDGRGVTSKPEVWHATLDSVRKVVSALAPLVREAYRLKR